MQEPLIDFDEDFQRQFMQDLERAALGFEDSNFMQSFQAWVKNEAPGPEDIGKLLDEDKIQPQIHLTSMFRIRDEFIRKFGFSVPTPGLVSRLAEIGPIIEVGAGHGTLTCLINNAGGSSVATDINPRKMAQSPEDAWAPVQEMSATDSVSAYPDRTVLSSWPSLGGTWLTEMALAMAPGQSLITIGEGSGGCTGADCFWELVENGTLLVDQEILRGTDVWRFPSIHDRARAFRRS